ncbi:MAG: ABC transporter permease [Burkholderiaceae bacterium]
MDIGLLPVLNLAMALAVTAAVVAFTGQDPGRALSLLLRGAFGSALGFSYTLYYATTFVFTGLAVAVAYHAGLFNIGGEGQAVLGGIGTALVALALGDQYPVAVVLPLMVLAAMACGMAWAAVPAVLQAWRGSHVVITTIMFNFLASAFLSWLLVNVLKDPGNMTVESRSFGPGAQVPGMDALLAAVGIAWPHSPLNLSLFLALAAALGVYLWLWRGTSGYAVRSVGFSAGAAQYAGIRPGRQVVVAMGVSGALAGLLSINEVAGVHGRLLLDYVVGAGFAGIAVSLIGRNHPVGVLLAALLFGALYQGGTELSFEMPGISRDMVFTLQGLIVLFCGALGQAAAPTLARGWARLARRREAARG